MNHDRKAELSLALRIANGDVRAVKIFFDRYSQLLFAFIFQRSGDKRNGAEDIWQETLLATVLRGMKDFRGQSSMFTWLRGIATHKAVDFYRKDKRHKELSFSEISEHTLDRLSNGVPGPKDVWQKQTERIKVLEVLASLPGKYHLALVARYRERKSVDEIGQILGKRYKAVESILSRARYAFRTALRNIQQEEGNDR